MGFQSKTTSVPNLLSFIVRITPHARKFLFFGLSYFWDLSTRYTIVATVSMLIYKDRFQIEEMTIIQIITENRLKHARGPVQYTESVT